MVKRGNKIEISPEKAIKGDMPYYNDEYGEAVRKQYYWHCGICNKKFIARRDARTCEDLHNAKCSECDNPATIQIISNRRYFCDEHYNGWPIYARLNELREEHDKKEIKEVD